MFLTLGLLLLILAPSPWNVVGALACAVFGVIEVGYWQRRLKRQKVRTGVENLVGATGTALAELAPSGQIRVLGEIWEARAAEPVPSGGAVRVLAVRGLELDVEAVGADGSAE